MAVESEKDFRVDLHCTNPGQTTVTLRLEITDHRYQQAYSQALFRDDVTFDVRNPNSFFHTIHKFIHLPIHSCAKIDFGLGRVSESLILIDR